MNESNKNANNSSNKLEKLNGNKTQEEVEEVSIPVINYFFINMIVFVVGFVPLSILIWSLKYIIPLLRLDNFFGFLPSRFLGVENFWYYFWGILFFILGIYLTILSTGFVSRLFVNYWHKKSPPEEGLYIRKFDGKDVIDPRIKYYHYRGFIIKYPLWLASKSPFPWLGAWILRYIGHNKIPKSVVFMDAYPGLEFTFFEDDVILMMGSSFSTHVVDSLYGNLTIKRIVTGKFSTIYPNSIFGPGVVIHQYSNLLPSTIGPKDWTTNETNKFYSGVPGKPIDDKYSGVFSRLKNELKEEFDKKGYILFK